MGLAIDEITYLSLPADALVGIVLRAEQVQVKGRGEQKIYRYSIR